jgi:AcrR family transcriptional regulator
MATRKQTTTTRQTLTRERVLAAAVALADEQGLDALSMRRLGQRLGVEAMSLYNHVANKDDLLDGIVDRVVGEFESPVDDDGTGWRAALWRCAIAAHAALLRHPWSAALAESRPQSGPERLGYYDALLGMLRDAGFSAMAAYQANLILDSYLYGFTLQEVSWPTSSEGPSEMASSFIDRTARDAYPNLMAVAALAADGQVDIAADFEIGLEVILDGLDRLRQRDLGA